MRMTTDILARAETELAAKVMIEVGGLLGRRRMSQADLARLMGVKAMWISDRFTGRVKLTVEDMDRIAKALGVDPVDLLPRPARGSGVTGQYSRPGHAALSHPIVGQAVRLPATSAVGVKRTEPTGR